MAPKPKSKGRPTDYREEYDEQARRLCLLGLTDIELAEFFGIAEKTLYNWKNDYPSFLQALNAGKTIADANVAASFYQRATGYERDAVKIFMPAGADYPVYAPFVEHIPAEPGAAKSWLTNRRGKNWRDKSEVELSVDENLSALLDAAKKRG